jgi:adenine-specific DNA-methyltransferase
MLDRATVARIRRLAAKGHGTVVIAREIGAAPKTVRRYLTSAEADVQIRPRARRLTPDQVALVMDVFREEAGFNASLTAKVVWARGIVASARTIDRVIASNWKGRRPRRRPVRVATTAADSFAFTWAGKSEALKAAQQPTEGRLVRRGTAAEGRHGHEMIEADNLDALKLLRQTRGAFVKAAYLDPPYGTGTKFTYDDRFAPIGGGDRRDAKNAAWLSMLFPRLMVLRDLLLANGVVVISIDDRHVHHVRMLMDEIFGEEQFVACITVRSNPRGKSLRRHVATNHEFLIVYAKDRGAPDLMGGERLRAEDVARHYRHADKQGRYALYLLRGTDHRRRRQHQESMFYALFVDPRTGEVSTRRAGRYTVTVYPEATGGDGDGVWTWGRARAASETNHLIAKRSSRGIWRIFRKVYAESDAAYSRATSIWSEKTFSYAAGKRAVDAAVGEGVFQFAKPVELLTRVVAVTTRRTHRDVVLDVFGGSGTVAEALIALNREDGGDRRVITLQQAEPTPEGSAAREAGYRTVADICRARMRRACALTMPKTSFETHIVVKPKPRRAS